jgi:hypothetical protein
MNDALDGSAEGLDDDDDEHDRAAVSCSKARSLVYQELQN